jgi:hypothetical protein
VNPDETGFYSLEIPAGTWEVTASLNGYLTGVVTDVVVEVEQTTPDVDFYLYLAPDVGYIAGYVTLVNGSGDVTDATVAAGGQSTHPSANGYYFLALPEGTYTVAASHPYAISDSIADVAVVTGATTDNINFELEIVRADLVCKAVDDFNNLLNNVDVEITGPEGTYTGTITNDSLIFENLPYGLYNGTALMEGWWPVYENDELDGSDHDIVFCICTTGIKDDKVISGESLVVSPNPFSAITHITVRLNDPAAVSLKIYSQQGQLITTLIDGHMDAGTYQMNWNGKDNSGKNITPGTYMIVLQSSEGRLAKVLIKSKTDN